MEALRFWSSSVLKLPGLAECGNSTYTKQICDPQGDHAHYQLDKDYGAKLYINVSFLFCFFLLKRISINQGQ